MCAFLISSNCEMAQGSQWRSVSAFDFQIIHCSSKAVCPNSNPNGCPRGNSHNATYTKHMSPGLHIEKSVAIDTARCHTI